jgi:S-(hydroxymethyl)glutathione dehydrogenase/alcohol dehydrogenase
MVRAGVLRSADPAMGGTADSAVEIVEIELPEVGPDDVRVIISAAGVCHSDLSMINGTLIPQFPVVLGHEAAGVVAEVGTAVTSIAIGDHVVLNWAPPCRRCWFCLNREPWLCREVEGVASTPGGTLDGEQVHLCLGVGGFAEQVMVRSRAVVRIPDALPLDVAALLGCAVLTGIGAVTTTAAVRAGESVVVFGLGGVGLSAVVGARLAGAYPVIAVDINADKEKLARELGATHFVPSDAGVVKRIRSLTAGRGADHAFECIGRGETIRTAWQSTRRGGQAVVVGVGARSSEVTFNALELFHFNRRLTSSVYGSGDPDRDVPLLAAQILGGTLDLGPLITDRIGLDGVNEAFDRMLAGVGARSVIVFD